MIEVYFLWNSVLLLVIKSNILRVRSIRIWTPWFTEISITDFLNCLLHLLLGGFLCKIDLKKSPWNHSPDSAEHEMYKSKRISVNRGGIGGGGGHSVKILKWAKGTSLGFWLGDLLYLPCLQITKVKSPPYWRGLITHFMSDSLVTRSIWMDTCNRTVRTVTWGLVHCGWWKICIMWLYVSYHYMP